MSRFIQRTWAQVDLDKVSRNYSRIRSYVTKGCKIMSIVKADAYGNGAAYVAKELDAAGTDYFGVSNIEEAIQLRLVGIDKPVLILGYTPTACAADLIRYRITQTVFSLPYARELSEAATKAGGRITIHIKIDTGMSRIGFVVNDHKDAASVTEIIEAVSLPGLDPEGIFTHFAVSDEPGNDYTHVQFRRFTHVIDMLTAAGVTFSIRHCCNSAGLLNYPEMHLDMVRPGIILYGMTPAVGMPIPIELEPVMELKTVVFQTKTLEEGTAVSYGMKYVTPGKRTVATLPIGYADGFVRSLSNSAEVLINGHRAGIVGRVCMDQCMADITDIDGVQENTIVTVVGRDGDETVTMEEISDKIGTINYETSCLIGKRVPRVFYKNGEEAGLQDDILPIK